MKIGSRLLAILALGALSTHVAVAGYHGHRASVGTAASHSGTDTQSLVKAPVAGSRQVSVQPCRATLRITRMAAS
jgi:hypothetical protein